MFHARTELDIKLSDLLGRVSRRGGGRVRENIYSFESSPILGEHLDMVATAFSSS